MKKVTGNITTKKSKLLKQSITTPPDKTTAISFYLGLPCNLSCTKNVNEKFYTYFLLACLSSFILFFSSIILASEKENTATQIHEIDLRHEPIQPLQLPIGLDPNIMQLGEQLFNESLLSRENDMSCSSCHLLNQNGADHLQYSIGRKGVKLDTNTLTVFNSSFNHRLFWDGRAATLEDQINFVVTGIKEFDTTWAIIISKLKNDNQYYHAFNSLYTDGITAKNIRHAIATFERSLITINSPFDQYLLGDPNAINDREKMGYQLFKNYGCIACHQGRNVGGNLFMKFGIFKNRFDRGYITRADLGRFNLTNKESDRHVFRVPSLRLVALTPPYFHDGSASTLEEAIGIMATHQLGREIPTKDISLIAAFLKTLPGEYKGRLLPHLSH